MPVRRMAAVTSVLYFLTITILSQNGRNLPRIVSDISTVLNDSTTDSHILYKFKVAGEPMVIAVVSVQNTTVLDQIVNRLWSVGDFEINSQPMITYESFARNNGVSDDLTQPVCNILEKENVYWVTFNVDYNNHTTQELLAIWKTEAESVLEARKSGQMRIVLFKNLAERVVPAFLNAPDPDQFDQQSFTFPVVKGLGSDVHIHSKGVQFLGDYNGCFN